MDREQTKTVEILYTRYRCIPAHKSGECIYLRTVVLHLEPGRRKCSKICLTKTGLISLSHTKIFALHTSEKKWETEKACSHKMTLGGQLGQIFEITDVNYRPWTRAVDPWNRLSDQKQSWQTRNNSRRGWKDLKISVPDPWHFGVDPDPRIHASD